LIRPAYAFSGLRAARGNVFALLFGAVALTGVLAAVGMQTLTGPVTTITRVTQKNIAETNLLMNAKIIANAVPLGANTGDFDSDTTKEAAAFVNAAGGETPPTNGGYLPTDLGLALTDPWGTKYGYCVWNHGSTNTAASGISGRSYIVGDNTTQAQIGIQPLIAIITAGPDKIFQTGCPSFTSGIMNVVKAAGSDDIVQEFTYEGASAAANGLWTLDAPGGQVAQLRDSANAAVQVSINRDTGIGDFVGVTTATIAAKTDNVAMDGGLKMDVLGAEVCDAASDGVVRYDATEKLLVVCDGVSEWAPTGGSLWETDDGTHVWRETGNVGIGKASPSVPLDVVGETNIAGAVDVTGTGAFSGNFTVGTDALSVDATGKMVGIGVATPTVALDVAGDTLLTGNAAVTGDVAVAVDVFTVDATDGTIGIGTAAPEHQLDIIGSGTMGTIGNLDEGDALVRIQEASSGPNLYLDGNTIITDATMLIGSIGNAGMQFLANSSVAMQIDAASGVSTTANLGVGTTLSVNGATTLGSTLNVADDAAFNTDTLFVDVSADSVGIGTNVPQARLDVDGGIRIGLHNSGTSCTPDGVVQFNGSQLQVCVGGAWSGVSSIEKLDDIGDVNVPTPNEGEVLAWDDASDTWVAKNIIDLGPGNATAHGDDGDIQFNGGDELDSHPDFFFDKDDVRLGIGTSSPLTTLHVDGTGTVSGDVTLGEDLAVDGTTLVVNATLNSVGIGTATPKAALEVAGGIKLGNDANCAADKDGTLRFTGVVLEICISEVWSPIQGSSGGAGGPGTTMVTGWPDAINCGPTNEPSIYYLTQGPAASGKYEYRNIWHNAERVVRFNADKTYFDKDTPVTDTGCTNQAIAVLYAAQRAYNFVGGSGNEDTLSFVPTAPDAIDCGDHAVNDTRRMLFLQTATTTRWTYGFIAAAAGIGMQVSFNPTDGTWIETINTANWPNADQCDTRTIADLTADDRTFNLAGGGASADPDTTTATGSDGYVQFATAGVLDGDSGLQFNKASDRLTIGAGVKVGNDTTCAVGGADNGTIRFNGTRPEFCYNNTWLDTGVADGNKTDITVSGNSWTINSGAVTLSDMANISANTVLGRGTGSGAPQALSLGTGLSITGTTLNADVLTDGDKGDITVSSSGTSWNIDSGAVGTAEIADGTVGYSDIQNVTGSRLLGRYAAATGSTQEISVGTGLTLSTGGVLSANVSAGVAGADKQVQFNDGGSTLAGATQLIWLKASNRLGIGATSDPTQALDVTGTATATKLNAKPMAALPAPAGGTGTSYWTLASGNVYRTTGNVGVGINPTVKFDVAQTADSVNMARFLKTTTAGSGTGYSTGYQSAALFAQNSPYAIATLPATVRAGVVGVGTACGSGCAAASGYLSPGVMGYIPGGGHGSAAVAGLFQRGDTNQQLILQGNSSDTMLIYPMVLRDLGSSTTRFIMDQSGQIGVGIAPKAAAHLKSANTLDYQLIMGSTGQDTFEWGMGRDGDSDGRFSVAYTANAWSTKSEFLTVLPSGAIGIGTSAPTSKLHVTGTTTGTSNGIIYAQDTVGSYSGGLATNLLVGGVNSEKHVYMGMLETLVSGTSTLGYFFINTDPASSTAAHTNPDLVITSAGLVGIAQSNPTHKLEVLQTGATNVSGLGLRKDVSNIASLYTNASNQFVISVNNNAGVYLTAGATSWASASDMRLKTNVETFSVLDRLKDYRAVSFDWKDSGKRDIGVIAQEVQKVFPEVVHEGNKDAELDAEKTGMWTVMYDKMGALALEAVKELKALVDGLADKVKELFDIVGKLQAENAALRTEVDNLKVQNAEILKRLDALEEKQ